MTEPTPLSLAAQAVLNAYANRAKRDLHSRWVEPAIAAALRAAADCLPSSAIYPSCDWGSGWRNGISDAKQKLFAIATELEASQ